MLEEDVIGIMVESDKEVPRRTEWRNPDTAAYTKRFAKRRKTGHENSQI